MVPRSISRRFQLFHALLACLGLLVGQGCGKPAAMNNSTVVPATAKDIGAPKDPLPLPPKD
jgi:hypothetical protein